ncbi:MAG: gamma-glutamyltransferase [Flavobacteriaceae bacterium]
MIQFTTNTLKPFLLIIGMLQYGLVFSQTYAKNGMVVSDNSMASEVGINILKKGGNAIDASIATAFALSVTYPAAGNIGGGGFIVYMDATGSATTIDFREKAPLAAIEKMFQDKNGALNADADHKGLKSVGVPGTVAGLFLAHQKYGKLPWAALLQPAIDLAKDGFPFPWGLYHDAQGINNHDRSPDFLKDYFLNEDGRSLQAGEIWKQPVLGATLELIRDRGKDGFYKGAVAQEIARYMKENGGIITEKDLEKYEAVERIPVSGTYKDYTIYGMPPPSSGGITLIAMMNLMELADLKSIEFNSTAYVHLVTEVMRRGFADRADYLGDPDFNLDMPLTKLLSKDYAKLRYGQIDPFKASVSDSTLLGQAYEGSHTTHLSVMDKEGNAVSLTYTLEESYGVGMGSSKLGFIFNNEMGDFNPVAGITTSTGQIGTKPNLIAPEKRMLSSMTPTIVSKDGKPYLVIGSPGGRTIINTVFQTVLNVLGYDMPIDRAIEAMKIHHQWLPDTIFYEKDLMSPDTRDALKSMGHKVQEVSRLGLLMGISFDAENKVFIGASDSASPEGKAVGY